MRTYLSEQMPSLKRGGSLIAISAFREAEYAEDWYLARWKLPITPSQRDPKWQLLGYDVADYSLETKVLSVLFFGQTDPNEEQWKPHLN